ncbi:MAG: hypothetical protein EON58_03355 [Alphaproteobacteria bacterium]|nr:MAG: hypothetical protein EON58_03355 [Alphaproteobacteria bacterium]
MPELSPKHLSELLALHEEVESARAELMPSSEDDFDDMLFMKLIRLASPGDEPVDMDFPARIEADRAAIKRAVAAGDREFSNRLIQLQS